MVVTGAASLLTVDITSRSPCRCSEPMVKMLLTNVSEHLPKNSRVPSSWRR